MNDRGKLISSPPLCRAYLIERLIDDKSGDRERMKSKYHVTRRPDGNWQGKLEGAERASVVRDTKAQTQQATIDIAKSVGNASVYIHGINGRIQEERTFPRSADPRESKG